MIFAMGFRIEMAPLFFSTIIVFLLLISTIFTFAETTNAPRLARYENLYKTYKCNFPPTNSTPPLFGKKSYLSKCDSVGDPLPIAGHHNLSVSLCQSLLDELLIVCHGPTASTKALVLFDNVKNMSASQLCQDPVLKRHQLENDWKLLNEPSICPSMCAGDRLWICRIRIFLWNYAEAVAAGTTIAEKVSKNGTNSSFQNNSTETTSMPTTASPNSSTTAPLHADDLTTSSTTKSPSKSFEETMKNIITNYPPNFGSHANDNTPGSVSHVSIHDAAKGSSRLGAKLFILFGVCSIIFIVIGYVMFYKRKQIRAFCCEDQGDVRYRRIREDRNQQAAQPLKNMNF